MSVERQSAEKKHEHDFLKMAAWYLNCLDIIEEEIATGIPWPDQFGLLLYEIDIRSEMKLILREWRHEKEKAQHTSPQTDRGEEERQQRARGLTLCKTSSS